MTRQEATDLVENLIQAAFDCENNDGPFRREDYLAFKARVIDALSQTEPIPQTLADVIFELQSHEPPTRNR